jgi:hypothetical protein
MLINKTYVNELIIAKMNFIPERPDLKFREHISILTIYDKTFNINGTELDFKRAVKRLDLINKNRSSSPSPQKRSKK